jgi:diguanylate cyclase (GGDEF)-like protein
VTNPLHWLPQRLSSRIVVLFLGLLLVVQGAGFVLVRWSINDNAHQLLARDLQSGEKVWSRLLELRAQKLAGAAGVLAADWGFLQALASEDVPTLSSALENHGNRIHATVTAMLAPDLKSVTLGGDAGPADGKTRAALATLHTLAPYMVEHMHGATGLVGDKPYQFVMVPVKRPLLVGYVVMGFEFDAGLLKDMHEVSGLHAAVLVQAGPGLESVAMSSLAPEVAAQLRGQPGDEPVLQGAAHVARSVGHGPGLRTVLLRSVDEAVAPYQTLQGNLAALALAGLVTAGAASVAAARRVTTPLRALVASSERLGRGEYGIPLDHIERADEIGELARAFDHMRVNIGAQQGEIQQLAYWDRLTGLPNRARFRQAVAAAIEGASGTGRPVAVLMLDLDRFKHVNDVLGYAFGDRLLKAVAERLRGQTAAQGDTVARFSGDEFALLLPDVDAKGALAMAQRIAEAFQTPLTLDDHTVDLAAGYGVACWPLHAADADTLINRAEVAMYSSKGKSQSALVYDPALDASSTQTLSLLSDLRHALDHHELRLYLQPKVALSGPRAGQCVGAEALVRWQHPARGLVPPMAFIPFAEQTGFVRHLTLWIFEATVREWPRLQALGLQRVSVNLSVRDLMDTDLPAKLAQLLAVHQVPATALCLEITESAIMDDPQRALATLHTLSAAGFKLSIDDFGTGYSSLAYLKRLPVDELKIDKSFVMTMEGDEDDAKIVRSTIDLAHNLGLTVVAEGVENAAILAHLAELQCDEAQGYHLARPMPAAEMATFAARWAARAEAVVG